MKFWSHQHQRASGSISLRRVRLVRVSPRISEGAETDGALYPLPPRPPLAFWRRLRRQSIPEGRAPWRRRLVPAPQPASLQMCPLQKDKVGAEPFAREKKLTVPPHRRQHGSFHVPGGRPYSAATPLRVFRWKSRVSPASPVLR